jgi:hypothetical protein
MENYCMSCGKWSWLPTFWRCQDCLDRFYDREAAAGGKSEIARASVVLS